MRPRDPPPPLYAASALPKNQYDDDEEEQEEDRVDANEIFPSGFPQYFDVGESSSEGIKYKEEVNFPPSCPATCTCVCPDVTIAKKSSFSETEKPTFEWKQTAESLSRPPSLLGLDVTTSSLYPCARKAGYQLNIALKMCRRVEKRRRK